MSIILHCSLCGKKIEAPDSAGGKWGKCPSCHNKLYVPSINTGDELKLTPLNEAEEEKKRKLMAESFKVSREILSEKQGPETKSFAGTADGVSEKQLTKNIILYLKLMADGELQEAQKITNMIPAGGSRASTILDRIAISEIPEPELANIPPQVLSGLIRELRTKIS